MEQTYNQLLVETLATFNNIPDMLLFGSIAVGLMLVIIHLAIGE